MHKHIAKLSDGCRVEVFRVGNFYGASLIEKGEEVVEKNHTTTKEKEITGDQITMTWLELKQAVIDGGVVRTKSGQSIRCNKGAEQTPDKKVKVVVGEEGKKILYQLL